MLKPELVVGLIVVLLSGVAMAGPETPHQIEKYGDPADGNPDVIDDRAGLKPEPGAAAGQGAAVDSGEATIYTDSVTEGNPDLGPRVPDADATAAEEASVYPDSVTEDNPDLIER